MIECDILVKNGTIIDPELRMHEKADLLIKDKRILAIETISRNIESNQLIDASGCLVTPGLIDAHVHVFKGGQWIGIDPDILGVGSGVPIVIDAGSAGSYTFESFHSSVVSRARSHVFAMINLGMIGIAHPRGGELAHPALFDEEKLVDVIQSYTNCIKAIKVRMSARATAKMGLSPLLKAKEVARKVHLPVVAHIGETDNDEELPSPNVADVANSLESGDILAHIYTGKRGGALIKDQPYPEIQRARSRGVLLEGSHGCNCFSFNVFDRMKKADIWADIIATDGHIYNRNGPSYDLPVVMSKFLGLGLSIDEVIRKTTSIPARAYCLDKIGALTNGNKSYVSILRPLEQDWVAYDSNGESRQMHLGIEPILCIVNNRIYSAEHFPRPYGSSLVKKWHW